MKFNNQSGIAHLALVVALVGTLILGAGVYVYRQNQNPLSSINNVEEIEDASLVSPLPENIKTIEEIRELVQAQNPNAQIGSIELEAEGTILVYRVELLNGDELVFDAITGNTLNGVEEEDSEDLESELPKNFVPSISFEQARETAQAKFPDSEIKKIKLKVRHDKAIYRVYFEKGAQVDVDATTGDIVRINKGDEKMNENGERNRSSGHRDDDAEDETDNGEHEDDENSGSNDDTEDNSDSNGGEH